MQCVKVAVSGILPSLCSNSRKKTVRNTRADATPMRLDT